MEKIAMIIIILALLQLFGHVSGAVCCCWTACGCESRRTECKIRGGEKVQTKREQTEKWKSY